MDDGDTLERETSVITMSDYVDESSGGDEPSEKNHDVPPIRDNNRIQCFGDRSNGNMNYRNGAAYGTEMETQVEGNQFVVNNEAGHTNGASGVSRSGDSRGEAVAAKVPFGGDGGKSQLDHDYHHVFTNAVPQMLNLLKPCAMSSLH